MVKILKGDIRHSIRASVKALEVHDTPDVRRLLQKLRGPDFDTLFRQGERLVEIEGTLTPFKDVKVKDALNDLQLLIVSQLTRADVRSWLTDNRSTLKYDIARLDWLWEFSWSFLLWGTDDEDDLTLYAAIRGPKPKDMKNVPFQGVLNGLRKDMLKARDRALYNAAKVGDVQTLVSMGLTTEEAILAMDKVARVSG